MNNFFKKIEIEFDENYFSIAKNRIEKYKRKLF